MSRFVVDAGVALKWYLPESHDREALRLLKGGHDLLAPDFFFAECGNVIWKRVRNRSVSVDDAFGLIEQLFEAGVGIVETKRILRQALEISIDHDRAVYDAVYLAVAIQEEAPFVTADEKLINALKDGPFSRHLLWVGDIPE